MSWLKFRNFRILTSFELTVEIETKLTMLLQYSSLHSVQKVAFLGIFFLKKTIFTARIFLSFYASICTYLVNIYEFSYGQMFVSFYVI